MRYRSFDPAMSESVASSAEHTDARLPRGRRGMLGDGEGLFPRTSREQTFHGSFWGNYTDLSEVMALAADGKIRHTIKTIASDQLDEHLDPLRTSEIVGRAVMKF